MGDRLEKSIEAAFLRKLKRAFPQVKCLKLNTMFNRSWPDRMILIPGGAPIFIEFKRGGGKVTPNQSDLHAELVELGYDVRVFDDDELAFQYVFERVKNVQNSKKSDPGLSRK